VGALGAAVVRVQVLDELRAGLAEGEGPGGGVAVGVAGVGEDVAQADAVLGHAGQHGGLHPGHVTRLVCGAATWSSFAALVVAVATTVVAAPARPYSSLCSTSVLNCRYSTDSARMASINCW
jgi:hypothetical protein